MDKHQSSWESALDDAQRQANEKQQAAIIAELRALRLENAKFRAMAEEVKTALEVLTAKIPPERWEKAWIKL